MSLSDATYFVATLRDNGWMPRGTFAAEVDATNFAARCAHDSPGVVGIVYRAICTVQAKVVSTVRTNIIDPDVDESTDPGARKAEP